MDYINIPISLIYKRRDDLKDFGVLTPGTMNYQLFKRLKEQALMGVAGAREVALKCYNHAYYVCTLILLEAKEFPELRISDYVNKILEIEKDNKYKDEVCLASMAMACLLLASYDEKEYGKESDVRKAIYHRCTHYQWYHSSLTSIFLYIMSGEYRISTSLSREEFEPRDIAEAIEELGKNEPYLLEHNVEYICERLNFLDDPRNRLSGADMAIAYLRDYLRDTYEDYGYDPKTNSFEPAIPGTFSVDPNFKECFWKEINSIKDAIEYISEHYPNIEEKYSEDSQEIVVESPQAPRTEAPQTKIEEQVSDQPEPSNSEIAKLQVRIQELQDALNKEIAKNSRLEEQIANNAQISCEEYENVKRRNDALESLNEAYVKRLECYESILGTEEQLSKEKQFSISERIVFCSALLGCSLSEDDISQMQMAKLIARFSGDKWESIRTTINKLNGRRTSLVEVANKANQEKDSGVSAAVWRIEGEKYKGITNAALNVYNYLHAAVKGETIGAKPHFCRQAMENIDQAYYLAQRKLIDRTDRQPDGEFELPPEDI